MADRLAPQRAGLTRFGVVMGQGRHVAGGRGQSAGIAQERQRDRCGAHQGPVAAGPPGARVVGRRCLSQRGRRRPGSGGGKNGPGLHAHVRGVPGPLGPPVRDRIQGWLVAEAAAVRGDLRDSHSHGRVIGPLPGLPAESAAADHPHRLSARQRRAELIARPEGIAARQPQQHPGGPIGLCRGQRRVPGCLGGQESPRSGW